MCDKNDVLGLLMNIEKARWRGRIGCWWYWFCCQCCCWWCWRDRDDDDDWTEENYDDDKTGEDDDDDDKDDDDGDKDDDDNDKAEYDDDEVTVNFCKEFLFGDFFFNISNNRTTVHFGIYLISQNIYCIIFNELIKCTQNEPLETFFGETSNYERF